MRMLPSSSADRRTAGSLYPTRRYPLDTLLRSPADCGPMDAQRRRHRPKACGLREGVMITSRAAIASVMFTSFVGAALTAVAGEQTGTLAGRTELHVISTLTLSDAQFLAG